MKNYCFKFPELYQFFGGYFYQGWASDYRWENSAPNFSAVVRHFKAINPPPFVALVRNQLEDLLGEDLEEAKLAEALNQLGSNFYPPAENLDSRRWLEQILAVLRESPTKDRILRELK